jgi:hypothetical protein
MEIINYPNYLIYDDGRVFSKERKDSMGRKVKGKFMKIRDNGKGYYQVSVCKDSKHKDLYIHRLVAEHYIPNPENKLEVDHIDNNKQNNSIKNLRWATRSQQNINRKQLPNNKSGFRGVCFHKPTKKYQVQIHHNGKYEALGYYATAEEASAVYEAKAKEVFGEFYREIV